MKTIEKVLSEGKPFIVDHIACMQHAEAIKTYVRPEEKHAWTDLPKHIQLGFKIAFISVCHQFNWDFMQNALADNILASHDLIPEKLRDTTARDVKRWLGSYPKKERIRAKERAKLLRNVGHVIGEIYNDSLLDLYNACAASKLSDDSFDNIMNQFSGYENDPLKKKTNVLTHDLIKENIILFEDQDYAKPAIDYHIMRLYLRSGRVSPTDQSVSDFLLKDISPRASLVRHLREAVAEAEKLVSFYSGLNIADVNYIEWQIGRSVCLNEGPLCQNQSAKIEIAEDVGHLCSGSCPYVEVCEAYNRDKKFIQFQEPKYVSTDY